MSSRFAVASWSPAPPLAANACSADRIASREAPRRGARGRRLDEQPELDQGVQVFEAGQRRDGVAPSRFLDHQPLGLHPCQCLPNRGRRDPEGARQRIDVQPLAGVEIVIHQHVDEHVVDVVDEGWAFAEQALSRRRADVPVEVDVRHGAPGSDSDGDGLYPRFGPCLCPIGNVILVAQRFGIRLPAHWGRKV